eukprot:6088992-Amphidinium_carterae.1
MSMSGGLPQNFPRVALPTYAFHAQFKQGHKACVQARMLIICTVATCLPKTSVQCLTNTRVMHTVFTRLGRHAHFHAKGGQYSNVDAFG